MDYYPAGAQAVVYRTKKYGKGDKVRVVEVKDFSSELCGGTHVPNVTRLQPFTIIKE